MRQEFWTRDLASSREITIAAAHIADPYILLQFSTGLLCLLRADAGTCSVGPLPAGPALQALGPVAAACLYTDTCNWLQRSLAAAEAPRVYCMTCTSAGDLSLYSLPSAKEQDEQSEVSLVWTTTGFGAGYTILKPGDTALANTMSTTSDTVPVVKEIRLDSFASIAACRPDVLGAKQSSMPLCDAPILVALTADHTLLVYKAVRDLGSPNNAAGDLASPFKFIRTHLRGVPPTLPPALSSSNSPTPNPPPATETAAAPIYRSRLVLFDGLGEDIPHSGIIVTGALPIWLVAQRGSISAVPMRLPQNVHAFGLTPFHNPLCPHGFITVVGGSGATTPGSSRGGIQISQLPPKVRLTDGWVRRKIALKATPVKAALYPEAGLFAVGVARQIPYKPFLPEEDGGEPEACYTYALLDATAKAKGTMIGHEVRLIDPILWNTVWKHSLLPGEHVLIIKPVQLTDTTTGNTVPLLAVGAGLLAGEDYPCGGRIILFEITRASSTAPGSGGSNTSTAEWAVRQIYQREFKSAVTAVETVDGNLLLSTGNRIEVCIMSSNTLNTAKDDGTLESETKYSLMRGAFYEGPMMVTGLTVKKSFILLADCQQSVHFVQYKTKVTQLFVCLFFTIDFI